MSRLIGSNAVTMRTQSSRHVVETEIAILRLDDIHPKVHRIIEDDLLRLFRKDAVTSHMADIRFVPIELNLGPFMYLP